MRARAVRKHHIILGAALIVVTALLVLAGGLFVDAAQTNDSYDALSAHRVPVTGRLLGCAYAGGTDTRGQPTAHVCRFAYDYRGDAFTMILPFGERGIAYVDPVNVSVRMSKVDFEGGPRAIDVDLVIASLLLVGAVLIMTFHEFYRRRRRRRRVRTGQAPIGFAP